MPLSALMQKFVRNCYAVTRPHNEERDAIVASCNNDVELRKLTKRKRKRFERPRFRVYNDVSRVGLEKRIYQDHDESDFLNTLDDVSDCTTTVEDKSVYVELPNDFFIGDHAKSAEDSCPEVFFDAQDNQEDTSLRMSQSDLKVHIKLNGQTFVISIEGAKPENFHISKTAFEKRGLDLFFSANKHDTPLVDILSGGETIPREPTVNLDSGDFQMIPAKTNMAVQTTVIIGGEELTETEDISLLSSRVNDLTLTTNILDIKESQKSIGLGVSEISDHISPPITPIPNHLANLNHQQTKLATNSTVSSIPQNIISQQISQEQTEFLHRFIETNSSLAESTSASRAQDITESYLPIPLIKSKSDSLILSEKWRISTNNYNYEIMKENSAYPNLLSLLSNPTKADNWGKQYTNSSTNYSLIDSSRNAGEYGSDRSDASTLNSNEEIPERPMTSAADAVKTMHHALKPINDQINNIRTKMLDMNIQPRKTSIHNANHRPLSQMTSRDYYKPSFRTNHWLVTDPEEFDTTRTTTASTIRGNEYLVKDAPLQIRPSPLQQRKLVIFSTSLTDRERELSKMSLTRSSIISEPEDAFRDPCNISKTRRHP